LISGQQDLPFCGGDCRGILDVDVERPNYPKATPLEVYVHPNAGHGLNLHYNSSAAYAVINGFLNSNGL
jgi:hypothetical protein